MNIKNLVQQKKWYKDLPRKEYDNYKHILNHKNWYEVYDLGTNTYAIYEPGHFQEVISYLIIGSTSALLLDTGLGICPIKPLVEELTDLPLFVVNSHCHFDHIGGNWEFDNVFIYNHKAAKQRLQTGIPTLDVIEHLKDDSVWIPYPNGFDPSTYNIKPCNCSGIENGHIFDLGGRLIEVLHTPGHSPDSIMLWDQKYQILFTGDTFYPATMYAHLTDKNGINSDFDDYLDTMVDLNQRIDAKYLYTSHNYPVVDGKVLAKVSDAFMAIASGKLSYLTDQQNLKKFQFDGFSIVCK